MCKLKKLATAIGCVVLLSHCVTTGFSRTIESQELMSALTLNIARFTRWPKAVAEQSSVFLNLCVIGDNSVQQSFLPYNNELVKNQPIKIIYISRLRNMSQCHLLYLSGMEKSSLSLLLLELRKWPILTIGQGYSFLQAGGMIALENKDGRIQLSVNLLTLNSSGLILSSRLLKLATIVWLPYVAP